MIKIINKAFQVGDKAYVSVEAAQKAELQSLVDTIVPHSTDGIEQNKCMTNVSGIPDFILANKAKILDILTTTASSRPTRRKINGGSKSRPVPLVSVGPLLK